jgi:hypothetical protein
MWRVGRWADFFRDCFLSIAIGDAIGLILGAQLLLLLHVSSSIQ